MTQAASVCGFMLHEETAIMFAGELFLARLRKFNRSDLMAGWKIVLTFKALTPTPAHVDTVEEHRILSSLVATPGTKTISLTNVTAPSLSFHLRMCPRKDA